jgi:hypothetical protein
MNPDERDDLIKLIRGHAAAMEAQVENPDVPLEYLIDGQWFPLLGRNRLFDNEGVGMWAWHRLAPAPKMVPLDQSDFLGEGRITHLRLGVAVFNSFVTTPASVVTGPHYMPYDHFCAKWECSRDGGETWGPCSKCEVAK